MIIIHNIKSITIVFLYCNYHFSSSFTKLTINKQAKQEIKIAEILFRIDRILVFIFLPSVPNDKTIKVCVKHAAQQPPRIAEIIDCETSTTDEKIAP